MKLWKALATVFIVYLVFLSFYVTLELTKPLSISEDTEVYVPKGASFTTIAKIFKEKGIIRNETLFIIIGKIYGIERKARAGYYLFKKEMTVLDVIKKLLEGKITEYTVTIIEGDSLYEIADKLGNINPEFKEQLFVLAYNKDFLKSLRIDAPSLEGYLFPDTYNIPKGLELEEIVKLMVKRFWEVYDERLIEKTKKIGWTINEVVTLASIIEKEAKLDEEKPLISAVYHNRLKIGMPLQADPTAIYGIKRYKDGVTKKDLQNKTPYNTYLIKGLPPGPIASPGLKSILAALSPAKVSYLYFVARGDGSHEFSVDYRRHIANINQLKSKKSD
ncbi:MAG: endolytic transglycosylase MltG [Thermodesulfovibrio sp.]|nr:endolytic transglycosylase MltG [Thermodesulfovibrio sp.]MDW7972110.1 endolytic transglycosylase MltG [Thermodesulfovibrio sp.]